MSALRQPLARPVAERAEPTNIHMPRKLKMDLARAAVDRYGWSMTKLVNVLAQKEVSHKRGLVNAKLK